MAKKILLKPSDDQRRGLRMMMLDLLKKINDHQEKS